MKVIPCICSLILITTTALAAPLPTAQGTINFDFGPKNNPVQTGFTAVTASVAHVEGPFVYEFKGNPSSATSGDVTLTLSEGKTLDSHEKMCARDRGEVAGGKDFKLGDLYRDFITGPSTISIGVEGLFVGATYKVTVYCFDMQNSQTMQFSDYSTGKVGDRVRIEYNKNQPVGSLEEAVKIGTIRVTVPTSGRLLLTVQALTGGSAVINGLTFSVAGQDDR